MKQRGAGVQQILRTHWSRIGFAHLLSFPASLLFRALVALRRLLYKTSLLKTVMLPIPVIVVGNISVGGAGKTPLVMWLATRLAARGMRPGIISRGYGGKLRGPYQVNRESDPRLVGDEPVLLAQRTACPVWIAHDRVAAAARLLQQHPGCDVLIADDGLQHYRLGRVIEIAVIDAASGLGNRLMLPAGPLREPASRLRSVTAIVVNGNGVDSKPEQSPVSLRPPIYPMTLRGAELGNLLNPDARIPVLSLRGLRVAALAGIGNPQRFFDHLAQLGLDFTAYPLPDHHVFSAGDLEIPDFDAIVMTEKDAVKCRAAAIGSEKCWVLDVEAVLPDALEDFIIDKLRPGKTSR
ncbi:MAG: tetraacyldisaccharide 4'-kinase [Burkholderiales bacterium]|nr:tetraacyldisaccharide 4'-kinase [Burkholderiales bacterium]MDQ3195015.1 tetraacyldisaccharide 4'-kinase [Pseudomonadota bacterium]